MLVCDVLGFFLLLIYGIICVLIFEVNFVGSCVVFSFWIYCVILLYILRLFGFKVRIGWLCINF